MNAPQPDPEPERLPLMADPEAAAMLRDPELYRQAIEAAAEAEPLPLFNAAQGKPWIESQPAPERLPTFAEVMRRPFFPHAYTDTPETRAYRDRELAALGFVREVTYLSNPEGLSLMGVRLLDAGPSVTEESAPRSLPFSLPLDRLEQLDAEIAELRQVWDAMHTAEHRARYHAALEERLLVAIMAKEPGRAPRIQPEELAHRGRCTIWPDGLRVWSWDGEPILEEPARPDRYGAWPAFSSWPWPHFTDFGRCPCYERRQCGDNAYDFPANGHRDDPRKNSADAGQAQQ